MSRSYKVRQEINFEFTETEKVMKRMKEIMEGSEDHMNSRIHTEGFEDGNLQKGHSHHQFDAP